VILRFFVSGLLLVAAGVAHAEGEAPTEDVRRKVYTAVVFAMAADSLCGTGYLRNVIENAAHDGVTLDDIMRRDKAEIDERANHLITQNADQAHKEKFCAMIKRDAESTPDE
jgi:hypothetical protein